MLAINVPSAFLALLFSACLYFFLVVIYRLAFHPLAFFPGPKLAAATNLIQIYYDLIHRGGGQFPFAYRSWHEKHGPIIRITPDELHIQDSAYYETIYASTRPVRKWKHFGYRFQNELTSFGAEDQETYRIRRSALNPFFSRRRVVNHVPRLQAVLSKLVKRLEDEYVGTGKVLDITGMWGCYAADAVVDYTFDKSYDFLGSPEFHSDINEAVSNMTELSHWLANFHWIAQLLRIMPERLMQGLDPGLKPLFSFWRNQETQILKVMASFDAGEKLDDRILFTSLLRQDVESGKHELTFGRLQQEAKAIVGAGSETVARAISLGTFHILNHADIKQRLIAELREAVPDGSPMLGWDALSKLPYLSACIEEALRMTYGVSERRARAYDGGPLCYRGWSIPAGTFVSMDNYDVSHDETIFPDSHTYRPERWLGDPKAPDGKQLSRYMVSFGGKGMRNCVGFQLAYAEFYLALANFFRAPFAETASLYESSVIDTKMARCRFAPKPPLSSKGVRALL